MNDVRVEQDIPPRVKILWTLRVDLPSKRETALLVRSEELVQIPYPALFSFDISGFANSSPIV